IATPAHVALFREQLAAEGHDVATAEAKGQLIVRDAATCLRRFMVGRKPDRERFFRLGRSLVSETREAGYTSARLYGEMVDLLWNGSWPATVALEHLWTEFLAETALPLLCAYRMDNFDPGLQRGAVHEISECHTELIPVQDYERLEHAVDRAYSEVFGNAGEAALLRQQITAQYRGRTKMPWAEVALLALRDITPLIADSVINSARRHYHAAR